MIRIAERIVAKLEPLLIPVTALTTVFVAVYGFAYFHIVGKVVAVVVLGMLAWASWIGFHQNRGDNDEWRFNLVLLGASTIAIVALAASVFI
mgnify:CR=1 FL=1